MRTPIRTSLTLVALLVAPQARAQAPDAGILASEAVIREIHATRPAFTALAVTERQITHLWLHANCAVGLDETRAQLVKIGAVTERAFVEAFQMGPPTAFLSEQAATRRADHAAIRAAVAEGDELPFDARIRERVSAQSEETYVQESLDRTIANYRIAALDGLALVGARTGLTWLERAAPKIADAELRRAAERCLATLRTRARTRS